MEACGDFVGDGGHVVVQEPHAGGSDALRAAYLDQYSSLVRSAAFLLHDAAEAEDVVHDVFVHLLSKVEQTRTTENIGAYIHRSVVNRTRSVIRHRAVVVRNASRLPPDAQFVDDSYAAFNRHALVMALRSLPTRERETIVLRFYAGLSLAETAHAMKVSTGSVKSHCSRGLRKLADLLQETP
jgi:RNA polymerase sigma-70 factor (sigma-E family)